MSGDRRSFLIRSTAAVAGVLLPGNLKAQQAAPTQANPEALSHSKQNLAFTGGNWFDGKGFAGEQTRTFYSIAGVLSSKKHGRVDSVIDLKNWFIVPPFGESHNHNAGGDLRRSQQVSCYK